jgi:hypothetical protein
VTVHTISCDSDWLDNGQAHVVVAQLAPVENVLSGETRPSVLQSIRELLADPRRLAEIVTQGRPAILLLPELAIAFSDWSVIDAMVRAYPTPLIVISGFSLTRGVDLLAWAAGSNGDTSREVAWDADHPPANTRRYNGGWCWVHTPDETRCIAFQKGTAQQNDEAQVDGFDAGKNSFCLELGDLIVFPVICSDFLFVQEGQRVVVRTISQHISVYENDARRILVVGMVAQSKGHHLWRNAITDVVRNINTNKVNVCLVNWAYDLLATPEPEDQWRDYSGVYVAAERGARRSAMKAVRAFTNDAIGAAVPRVTEPCVVGGPIRWTFDATGKYIWTVNAGYTLDDRGTFKAVCCDDPIQYELMRFLRRQVEPPNAPSRKGTPCVADSISSMKAHLGIGDAPNAEEICHKSLFGERDRRSEEAISAEGIVKFEKELAQALPALGTLSLLQETEWQTDSWSRGQIRHAAEHAHVLVWSSPESGIAVKRKIDNWRDDPLQTVPLIVFSKTSGGLIAVDAPSDRRKNIAMTPPAKERSAAEPRQRNAIVEAGLDEILNCCHEENTAASIQAASNLVAQKLALVAAMPGVT